MSQNKLDELAQRFPLLSLRDIKRINQSFQLHGTKQATMLRDFTDGLSSVLTDYYLHLQKADALYIATIMDKSETWEINIKIDNNSLKWVCVSQSPIEPADLSRPL
ncbi:MAG: hypothetical protein MI867_06465 [Pseudomonadales bacterium]|nr:hypothetical protein [Pseudomonadales bacterium]